MLVRLPHEHSRWAVVTSHYPSGNTWLYKKNERLRQLHSEPEKVATSANSHQAQIILFKADVQTWKQAARSTLETRGAAFEDGIHSAYLSEGMITDAFTAQDHRALVLG